MVLKPKAYCPFDKPKTKGQKNCLQIYCSKSTGLQKGVLPSRCQLEDTTQGRSGSSRGSVPQNKFS